jgi:hypothetical protein
MAPIERKSAKESKGNLRGAAAYCLNLVAVPRLLYGQSAVITSSKNMPVLKRWIDALYRGSLRPLAIKNYSTIRHPRLPSDSRDLYGSA